MPKVSIIMPVYNSEKYLEEAIQSVLKQTYTDWELIIVEDASKDKSLEIINRLKNEQFRILKNEKNVGAAECRNQAMKLACGEYLAFLDSDDVWQEDKLEKQLKFMKEMDCVFSFTSYMRMTEKGKITRMVEVPDKVTYSDFLKNAIILNSTVMVNRKKINQELLEMPNFKTCEDVAMFLKILRNGYVAEGLPEFLTKYRVRKHSLSSNKCANMRTLWKIYKNNENISFPKRCLNITKYMTNAVRKRIPKEIFRRLDAIFDMLTPKQVLDLLLFPFLLLASKIGEKKLKEKKIWVIEENPNEACDNGYAFFKYLREERKEVNAYYVIYPGSKDYARVKKFGNIIHHGSFKHWMYYLNAEKIVVTQKYANPSPAIFYWMHIKEKIKAPRIFLQHGVIKDDCAVFYYPRTKFRMFICGAKREYEYVKENFQYPLENVVYTGLARFDELDWKKDKKQKLILIAPTWRNWIKNQKSFEEFWAYYEAILKNTKLQAILKENEWKIQVVVHKKMKKFKLPKGIIKAKWLCINHNEDVEMDRLLQTADLLVTDYSSTFFDMAYRKRPIVYYQFDKKKYRKNQMPEGYFSYEKDGFGDVLEMPDLVSSKIVEYIENDLRIEPKYEERMEHFFERRDKKNCERIFRAIEEL